MPHRCAICDAAALPDGTKPVDVVNRLLTQKVSLRKIKEICGFDKSLVSRHTQKCITRQQAGEIKSWYFKSGDSVHVLWPGQTPPAHFGPRDWFIKVRYGREDVAQPTRMLSREEASALQLQLKTAKLPTQDKSESESEETATEETADAPEELKV
jgi:hypothetical protein